MLVKHGANLEILYNDYTLLDFAATEGSFILVKTLVELGAKINPDEDGVKTAKGKRGGAEGQSTLHLAVQYAKPESKYNIIEFLLKSGAKINAQNAMHNTVLHHAVYKNDIKSVNLLLEYNAEIILKNKHGHTPLLWALERCYLDIVSTLLSKIEDPSVCLVL